MPTFNNKAISKPVVLAIVAVFVLVVLAGALTWRYWPEPASELEQGLDTSGWLTYRNEAWGFEV